jgi:two-component system, OmpR family, phosphate regulon sensor histidine kinase PhoR
MDYASSSASGQQQEQEQARIESKFRLLWEKQTYVNLLYLLVSFPLGIFYIAFLLLALTSILNTSVILGVPVLLLVIFIWWRLARFERNLAMRWLRVEISPMAPPRNEGLNRWERFRAHLTNAVTWKSLAYLFVKFPLGIISFVVIINMFVLTLGFTAFSLIIGLLVMPFLYLFRALPRGHGEWREARTSEEGVAVDRGRLFLLLSITGFGFVLIAFHVLNALAYVSGQFARVMLGLSDTSTRLAQAKAIAEEERAKAERADQSRRELIVNVSHELRTPIASIRGHVESLLMEMEEQEGGNAPDPAELRDYLNIVHQEAERLSALVEDLLSLARMESDELHLNVVPIVAGEVVEEVYVTMAPLASRERQVTLIRKVAPMLPLILADRQRLVQVLLNLIRNAITYTPQGGIVSITVEQADADYLALVVADTGIGIPNDDLERVFERFYRTDTSRARTSGGFGLGLAIVRDLVNAMGGSITVESKVGEGSCFRVLLRIAVPGYYASVKDAPFV